MKITLQFDNEFETLEFPNGTDFPEFLKQEYEQRVVEPPEEKKSEVVQNSSFYEWARAMNCQEWNGFRKFYYHATPTTTPTRMDGIAGRTVLDEEEQDPDVSFNSNEYGYTNAILGIIASIALSIVSSFLYDGIKSLLFKPDNPAPVATINDESKNNLNSNLDDNKSYMEDFDEAQHNNSTKSPEPIKYQNYIEDISDKVFYSGSLNVEDQKDTYRYIPLIGDTYRFDTNLSSGGSVIIRISDENEDSIDYNYDALTINLEAGKTYMLSVEYRNGTCDYTVNIGVPIPINDISGTPSVSGSITYQEQKDRYYYTAPITGTYHLDTNLSSVGSVIVRISGENSKSINYDSLSIDLEAGKLYILSIEYRRDSCSYEALIKRLKADK